MQLLFRKHFWLFHSLFIFGGLFLLARTICHSLENEFDFTWPQENEAPSVSSSSPTSKLNQFGEELACKRNTFPSDGMSSGIRARSENEYDIDYREVDHTLSNLNEVTCVCSAVPAFKGGVAMGFKILSTQCNSIYAKIGVQNGDIIRRINGLELNSPEKALEIYMKLRNANRIDVELERNGSIIRKTYNVYR